MQIADRKTIPWFVLTLAAFVAATVAYLIYARSTPRGPHGGSIPGLLYAGFGSALILFALILNIRKRCLRTARLGRAYTWMQAHIWLGTLSYPIILYHAGLRWGGPLTQVLMWSFTLVILTGVIGLALQQFIPGVLKRDVPRETVIGQIEHVFDKLKAEADALVLSAERGGVERSDTGEMEPALTLTEPSGGVATAAAPTSTAARQRVLLRNFYNQRVAPLLDRKKTRKLSWSAWEKFNEGFTRTRAEFPQPLHETMDDLLSIVRERAQLESQRRLHRALHSWLLIHVPLSYVMVALGIIHAIYACKYGHIDNLRDFW